MKNPLFPTNLIDKLSIKNYNKWTDVIDLIVNSDYVFSSSLHGLIIAEAYGIPNYRIKISDLIIGGDFKFDDYYASIGKKVKAIKIQGLNEFINDEEKLNSWKIGRINTKTLLNVCPFKINVESKYEHPMDL